MDVYESGHLDCLFDCGLAFSNLETLHLHIELDHREDNDVSPFLARPDSPPVASSSWGQQMPQLPTRPPPRVPVHDEDSHGSSESEAEPFTLCPEPHCGEQILLVELNEHLDFHEAEKLIDEGSISGSDSNRDRALISYSSSSITRDLSEPSPTHVQKFTTDISPALKRKMDRQDQAETSPRVGMGRTFLSMIGLEKREADPPRTYVPRLDVSLPLSRLDPFP